ncbi:hypothetical protein Gain_0025_002 [Komagataeibacter intermedius TF2]|uniref:Energy transducer TonB n=3 Tax=Komagataeibacter intermedius TaxID=66229 RepID=A0A0N1F896_9PROT|nr:hypothetical protein GLUCOINTEAF2_0202785 [Komagataeibacter intermedius AF2]GAN86268.1 hypothetical protein Gain_0025_002 [Komagataeibacter intermedius TF2]GBQ71083.1 hypothetical protein AA0521_1833 [Komagataeibacter intermedius NRIC 0521]
MSGRDALFRNEKIVPHLLHIMLDTYAPTTPNQTLALNGAQAGQPCWRRLDRNGMWSDEVMGLDYAARQRRRTPYLRVVGVIIAVHVIVLSVLAYGLRPKAKPMFPEPYRPLPPVTLRIIPEPMPPVPPSPPPVRPVMLQPEVPLVPAPVIGRDRRVHMPEIVPKTIQAD